VKESKGESLPEMYLDGGNEPWPEGRGQERGGRGRVQVVFVWLQTKGLRQISPSLHDNSEKFRGSPKKSD
jgi:hypothetical protein